MDLTSDHDGISMWADELGEEIVSIIVGSKRKLFCVHKNLLRDGGNCFDVEGFGSRKIKKIKTNQWGRKTITLISFDPQAMSLLITWLYRKRLPDHPKSRNYFDALFELYYLAEMQQDVGLMDITMDRIQDHSRFHGSFMTVDYVQDVRRKSISPDSKLKTFAVFLFTYTFFQQCSRLQKRIRIEEAREEEAERTEVIADTGENAKDAQEKNDGGLALVGGKQIGDEEVVIVGMVDSEPQKSSEKERSCVDLTEERNPDTQVRNEDSNATDKDKVVVINDTNSNSEEREIVNETPVNDLQAVSNDKLNEVVSESRAQKAKEKLKQLWAYLYKDQQLLQEMIFHQATQESIEDPRIRNHGIPEDRHYFHKHNFGEPCFADEN